jgi:drug/metabolite transporter (DMT)-like permease
LILATEKVDEMAKAGTGQRWLGVGLLVASAVAFSTAGYFTRLIPQDVWTLLFWRGIFAGLFVGAILVWQHGSAAWRSIPAMGLPGLAVTALSSAGMIFFIHAFRHTSVADVGIIYAAAPFVTAGIAWYWLRERPGRGTLIASAIAFLGVAIMVGGSVRLGNWLGDMLALAMTLSLSLMMVVIRRHKERRMTAVAGLSPLLTTLLVWPLAAPGGVGPVDLGHLALFGVLQNGLGLLLLTWGTRFLPAAQGALIGALDAPLAPIWVWLAFNEIPPTLTLMGGAVVMLAVLGYLGGGGRTTVPADA